MKYKDLPPLTKQGAYDWYVSLGWPNGIDGHVDGGIDNYEQSSLEWIECIRTIHWMDKTIKSLTREMVEELVPYILEGK
jgi:hypothetical protein